jgi:hypothetical protein
VTTLPADRGVVLSRSIVLATLGRKETAPQAAPSISFGARFRPRLSSFHCSKAFGIDFRKLVFARACFVAPRESAQKVCVMYRIAFTAALSAGVFASAAEFAASVGPYTPGAGAGAYTTPAAAVGSPAPLTGQSIGFPNILSPFSPAFGTDEIVGIGLNGSIQLNFSTPISNVAGADFGVITNLGLADSSYPAGVNTNPASTFGAIRQADVAVSSDGAQFVSLGLVTFDSPANYFADASNPYLTAAPANATLADFGKPFSGNLATFNGLNWSQTLAALDGSGGGTWIDFSASGLSNIVAVQFSIGATAPGNSDGKLFIDAVVANNVAVPEPAISSFVIGVAVVLLRRR